MRLTQDLSIALEDRHPARFAVGTGVGVGLFLVFFQPVGISHDYGIEALWVAGYGVLTTLLLLVDGLVIRPLLRRVLERGHAHGPRAVWRRLWMFFFVGTGVVVYHGVLCGNAWWHPRFLLPMVAEVMLVSGMVVVCWVAWQGTRSSLLPPGNTLNAKAAADLVIVPLAGRPLRISPEAFIAARAVGNYTEVFVAGEPQRQRHLLRLPLTRLMAQLPDGYMRTHRSYAVNLARVVSIRGNAQGLKLKVDGLDEVIPVSRSNVSTIRALLSGTLG